MRPLYMIQISFACIAGIAAWFLGGIDGLVYTLAIFVLVDYLTGLMKAVSEGELSSKIGAKGIFKKILIFILIGLSNLVDGYLMDFGMFRTIAIFFYISNEGISILENANAMGLPIPEKLKKLFKEMGNTR